MWLKSGPQEAAVTVVVVVVVVVVWEAVHTGWDLHIMLATGSAMVWATAGAFPTTPRWARGPCEWRPSRWVRQGPLEILQPVPWG